MFLFYLYDVSMSQTKYSILVFVFVSVALSLSSISAAEISGIYLIGSENRTVDLKYRASASYSFTLLGMPYNDVEITATELNNFCSVIICPKSLIFTSKNWFIPQSFVLTAIEPEVSETIIEHSVESMDSRYARYKTKNITLSIINHCDEPYLACDFNKDCYVDFLDLLLFSNLWLTSYEEID